MTKLTKTTSMQIVNLVNNGVESWIKAGELISKVIDNNPKCMIKLSLKTGLSQSLLNALLRMGNKTLYPHLMLKDSLGYSRLEKCSYEAQEKYFSHPVDLLVVSKDGYDTLKVLIENLTKNQIGQVFNNGEIRSLPAQRAYLESFKTFSDITEAKLIYSIDGDSLIILRKTRFSKKQLIKIIDSM